MSLLTWLLMRLRRPPAPEVPASIAARSTPPTVLLGPPTEAERAARAEARLVEAEQRLAIGLTWENTKMLTPELHRLIIQLNYLRDDLAEARAHGWAAHELLLSMEAQQLEGHIQLLTWQHSLILDHGPDVGAKLGRHEVEVGMTLKQLFASYGTPPTGAISYAADEPGRWFIQYGSEGIGSYFELLDGVVTLAVLRQPELPAHVRDSPPVGEWPVEGQ